MAPGAERTGGGRGLRARLSRFLAPTAAGEAPVALAPVVPLREVFGRFWPYARPYRGWLAVGIALVALVPALDAAIIWLFKLVIDDVLVPRELAPLLPLALAYLGLTLLSGLVGFLEDYVSTWIGERFLLDLRTSLFRHLQGLSLGFFERRRLGDVLSRLTSDVAAIEGLVLGGVADALSYVLRIAFFCTALFILQWDLALASLIVVPAFFFIARRFARRIKEASREKRRRSGSIGAVAEESLANAALVQAYGREEVEIERFHRENQASFAAQMASTRIKALFTPLVDLIELVGAMVVIAMGTWELSRGRLTLGGLLVFMAYLSQLYSPIRGLSRLTTTIYSASAAAERIVEVLEEQPEVVDRPGARRLERARGVIELEDVGFRYPGEAGDALRGISLRAEPGETVALVGASGAGKTTLAKLLLRFYDPTAGAVRLDGHDLRDLRLADVRANMALLLQEALIFDTTVRENIAYGRPGATGAQIVAAARAADADGFIEALPEGYDTRVGQRGRRLSGGQRQRLAIARAMVRDAPVLVLDEPGTGLDAETGERVLAPMRRLMQDHTAIIIAHNLMTVREATQILVLDGGRVVERGTHAELLALRGEYARQWELHRPAREEALT